MFSQLTHPKTPLTAFTVDKVLSYFLTISIFIYAAYALIFNNYINSETSSIFFEFVFFFTAIFSFISLKKFKNRGVFLAISLGIFIYIIYTYILAVEINKKNILDYIWVNKFLIYGFLITICFNIDLLKKENLTKIFNILFPFFLVTYLYKFFLFGVPRPFIFTENNYELMTILVLYAIKKDDSEKKIDLEFFLLIILFVLSGSRSAMFAFFSYTAVNFLKISDLNTKKLFIYIPTIIISAGLVAYVFLDRMGSMELDQIDRIRFFNIFQYEISQMNFLQIIAGLEPITPLNTTACVRLEYYNSLFSHQNNGECYSVILHSFFMRVIIDHGIIGFLSSFGVLGYFLWKSPISQQTALSIFIITMSTSLSVSALNNAYLMLPILLIGLLKNENIEMRTYSF